MMNMKVVIKVSISSVGTLPVDSTRSYTCNMYIDGTSISKLRNKLNSAADAIAVRLAEMTARSAGGVDTGVAADVARAGAKAVVGWVMMTFWRVLR